MKLEGNWTTGNLPRESMMRRFEIPSKPERPGSYQCRTCGHVLQGVTVATLPPCPLCGATEFARLPMEPPAAK